MDELKRTNPILKILAITAAVLITVSIFLFRQASVNWRIELAKAMMGLAMTAVIGGFVKFMFDQNQKRQEDIKKAKEKEDDNKVKQKEFKNEILNRLRKIFDAVDGARLLIEAHKSAKTYGEKMRKAIIPSIVGLYDIKRTLVDSTDMMDIEKLKLLRLNMHFMIAYLQAMANEYRDKYLQISNTQFYEEEWKKQTRDIFIKTLIDNNHHTLVPKEFSNIKIPEAPISAWKKIELFPLIGKFIEDDYESLYRKMFVDFYEYSKKILKDQLITKRPAKFEAKYLTFLETIDRKKEEDNMTKDDSLVYTLIRDFIESKEDKTVPKAIHS